MAGMIMVNTKSEKELLLKLVGEFASRVIIPRGFVTNATFDKYKEMGIFGITGVEEDLKTSETLFQIELPPSYILYIQYEVDKLRSFVRANEELHLDKTAQT